MYLFTDIKAKKILALTSHENGFEAAVYRKKLSKALGEHVISWCQMGEENPRVEIP